METKVISIYPFANYKTLTAESEGRGTVTELSKHYSVLNLINAYDTDKTEEVFEMADCIHKVLASPSIKYDIVLIPFEITVFVLLRDNKIPITVIHPEYCTRKSMKTHLMLLNAVKPFAHESYTIPENKTVSEFIIQLLSGNNDKPNMSENRKDTEWICKKLLDQEITKIKLSTSDQKIFKPVVNEMKKELFILDKLSEESKDSLGMKLSKYDEKLGPCKLYVMHEKEYKELVEAKKTLDSIKQLTCNKKLDLP